MSRNYCGYCGTLGHNIRTCPDRPQEYKDMDRQWNAKPGRKKGSAVECSYCGLIGHNRRTCWHLDHRRSVALESLEEALSGGLRGLCEHGLGPGALYAKSDTWTDKQATYVITNGLSVRFDDDARGHGPMFFLNIAGQYVYGTRLVERDMAVTIQTVCSYRKQPVVRLAQLIEFATAPGCLICPSETPFPDPLLDRLRSQAVREVDEYYRRKDVHHPLKHLESRLEAIQAEAGWPIGLNTTTKKRK